MTEQQGMEGTGRWVGGGGVVLLERLLFDSLGSQPLRTCSLLPPLFQPGGRRFISTRAATVTVSRLAC